VDECKPLDYIRPLLSHMLTSPDVRHTATPHVTPHRLTPTLFELDNAVVRRLDALAQHFSEEEGATQPGTYTRSHFRST